MKAKQSVQWHKRLGWWAFVGILIWGVSAITHPLMSWFGPQSEKFFPPKLSFDAGSLHAFHISASESEFLSDAKVIKLVETSHGPLLQVTFDESSPREYYDVLNLGVDNTAEPLSEIKPIKGYDEAQAKWLAAYYTELPENKISSVSFITAFSDSYPSVNRLLPVYRINYADAKGTQAFVYTETGALAGLSNDYKLRMQWLFQNLHTFSWLNKLEFGRVILVSLFMLTLAATAAIGLALVFQLKSRKIKRVDRRYHRIFSYALWLPLFAWAASGFYHLLQSSLVEPVSGLRLGDKLPIADVSLEEKQIESLASNQVSSLSLITPDGQNLFWRASIVAKEIPEKETDEAIRLQRFKGKPAEASSLYLPINSLDLNVGNKQSDLNDQVLAERMAKRYVGEEYDIIHMDMVTRFGPNYDFRNKRLPVWRVELNDSSSTWLFLDPRTGVLVDQSRSVDRAERYSFSFLHKWNHLTPLTGRKNRDVLIVLTLILLISMSALGAVMMLKTAKKKAKSKSGAAANFEKNEASRGLEGFAPASD